MLSSRHGIVITVVLCVTAFASVQSAQPRSTAVSSPCGLRLAAPVHGELPFRLPRSGRAVRRVLRGAILRCALERRDGSLYARLLSDRRKRVLAVAFFRRDGSLRRSTGAVYAQQPSDTGAEVTCGTSTQSSIGPNYWTDTRDWRVGATPKGLDRGKAIKALRAAMDEWTKNVNYCGIKDQAGPPMHYAGETTRKAGQDGVSVVDWASLENHQDCKGALACTVTAYDGQGNPVESDTRFNTHYKWSTTGAKDAYDVQMVAAHEFGHVLQFDHVQGQNDHTSVMWPYLEIGDTSGRKLGKGEALADNSHY